MKTGDWLTFAAVLTALGIAVRGECVRWAERRRQQTSLLTALLIEVRANLSWAAQDIPLPDAPELHRDAWEAARAEVAAVCKGNTLHASMRAYELAVQRNVIVTQYQSMKVDDGSIPQYNDISTELRKHLVTLDEELTTLLRRRKVEVPERRSR